MRSFSSLKSYDFVELWAGRALTSECVRLSGRNTAALDIEYFRPDEEHPTRSNHFDILSKSGFLFLAETHIFWNDNIYMRCKLVDVYVNECSGP